MRPSTFLQVLRHVRNWREVFSLKYGSSGRRLSLLSTRDGVEFVLRRGCRDWDIFREIFLKQSYARSLSYLAGLPADSVVLDLGANIGCFSLRAALLNPKLRLHSYEPGPPNVRIFQLNLLANPRLAGRIELHQEAVSGVTTQAKWGFDEDNAGGSSLYGQRTGTSHPVTVRALSEIVRGISTEIALAKIDIEGAEYDVLRHTPRAVWSRIAALTIEFHDDPADQITRDQARQQLQELGYTVESDDAWTVFCRR